ncbi:hypothetical protein, partial [Mesorhizobium sp.]|uniref:hypothetical protein n=1 Tax=Mesorhizobium sp. TaxID=1871066 RepID=UPI0025F45F0B
MARSAKTVEGCWTERGGAKLEHPLCVSALRADPPSPTRGEGRAALALERLPFTECGDAKLEHPSSDLASRGHLLP